MRGAKWSSQEIDYLLANYQSQKVSSISKALFKINHGNYRTDIAIAVKARKLGLCEPNKRWSKEEEEYLKQHYADTSSKKIAKELFIINGGFWRSQGSIRSKAKAIRIKSNFYWKEEETRYLLSIAEEYPLRVLSQKYCSWAREHGYRMRSQTNLAEHLRRNNKSSRVIGSTKYLSFSDLQIFFGCDRGTVRRLLDFHCKELHPEEDGKGLAVSTYRLKNFLLNNQSILIKFQAKLDICWLADLLGGKF